MMSMISLGTPARQQFSHKSYTEMEFGTEHKHVGVQEFNDEERVGSPSQLGFLYRSVKRQDL
jgi:hypothetical protein